MRRVNEEEANQLMVRLGQRCKERRLENGLSGRKFAAMLEMTPNHLRRFENGQIGVSLSVLLNMATLLDISIDSVLLQSSEEDERVLHQLKALTQNEQIPLPDILKYLKAIVRVFESSINPELERDI